MQVGYVLRCYFSVPVQWCEKLNEGRYIYGRVRLFLVGFCMGHHSIALASSGGAWGSDWLLIFVFIPAIIVFMSIIIKSTAFSLSVYLGTIYYFVFYAALASRSVESVFHIYKNDLFGLLPILFVFQVMSFSALCVNHKNRKSNR